MPPILHPQAAAFLRAIKERPDDDVARLVYADWLTEQGDAERGEFIRLQVDLERLPEDDKRLPELRKRVAAIQRAHAKGWLPATVHALNGRGHRQVTDCKFRRGFLDSASLWPRRPGLVAAALDALALEPLERLRLHCGGGDVPLDQALAELAASPHVGGLRELQLSGQEGISPQSVRLLDSSPHLGRLTELDLRPRASPAALQALTGTALGRRLKVLSAHVQEGDGPGVLRALTTAPGLPELKELRLANGQFGDRGLARLASSPVLPALTALDLSFDHTIGPRGVKALVRTPLWPRLELLSIWQGSPGAEGTGAIAQALPQSALRELKLMKCGLDAEAARRLAQAPSWGRLEVLDLSYNHDFGEAGAVALAAAPGLARLKLLDLSLCGLGEGARAIAESPHVDGLGRFRWYDYSGPRGVRAALRRRFGQRFRER
jgi:uncharacterized protein (TIGR02996 family)